MERNRPYAGRIGRSAVLLCLDLAYVRHWPPSCSEVVLGTITCFYMEDFEIQQAQK
jgi:hypothetical protein